MSYRGARVREMIVDDLLDMPDATWGASINWSEPNLTHTTDTFTFKKTKKPSKITNWKKELQ